MKQLAIFAIMPFLSVSLNKCTYTQEEKKDLYNPYTIFVDNNRVKSREITMDDGYKFSIKDDEQTKDAAVINDAILSGVYTFTDTVDTENAHYFKYVLKRNAFLIGYNTYEYYFYDNGYASITVTESVKNKTDKEKTDYISKTYNYKFDADKALKLYDTVNNIAERFRQEEIAKQKEIEAREKEKERAQKALNAIKFEDIYNDMFNTDPLKLIYCYSSVIDEQFIEITDDGCIKELLRDATFENTGRDTYHPYVDYAYISKTILDEQGNELYKYQITFFDSDYSVEIKVSLVDSYHRTYSTSFFYNIGRTSMHAIFDKMIALYEAGSYVIV